MPSGKDICEKQLFNLADRLERVDITEDATLEAIFPTIMHKLDWLDKEELLRRLMLMEFRRLLDYYEEVEDIDEVGDSSRERGDSDKKKRTREAEEGMTRLFINFGKMDRMFPNKLIELINKCVPGRVAIGKIDLMARFSFFEVAEEDAADVVEALSQYEVDGRRIVVDYAEKAGNEGRSSKKRSEGSKRRRDERPRDRRSSAPRGERERERKSKRKDDGNFFDKYDKKRRR